MSIEIKVPPLPESVTDATLSFNNISDRNISFRMGVKNIFDNQVKYPAPVLTYLDDYPRDARQWWLQFVYDF